MSEFKDVDEAREFFQGDVFAGKNGIVIDELSEDGCVCSMEIGKDHKNAAGAVMGTVGFHSGGGCFAQFFNMRPCGIVTDMLDEHIRPLAHDAALDENRHAVDAGNTRTVTGIPLDECGVNLSFFERHRPLLP